MTNRLIMYFRKTETIFEIMGCSGILGFNITVFYLLKGEY